MEPPLIDHGELIKILISEGYALRKSRGTDHAYKRTTPAGSRTIIVPTHKRQIPRGTMRSILKQAGWSVQDLERLIASYL